MMQQGTFRAAAAQLRSGRSIEPNTEAAAALIRRAAAGGASYIQTPENTTLMEHDSERRLAAIRDEKDTAALTAFCRLAAELRVWLHIGSLAIRVGARMAANRSFVLTPEGEIAAKYDKIHMFDVNLPSGETYRESRDFQPGGKAVAVQLPWCRLGLTTCYDLRFPEQYKALALAGAGVIAVPSAFTRQTGKAHWHVLLRARAIETGCFIIAAAQGGRHENGRSTFGHSMIISPWGEILAEADEEPGVIFADLDMASVAEARRRIPALTHVRPFEVVVENAAHPASAAGRGMIE